MQVVHEPDEPLPPEKPSKGCFPYGRRLWTLLNLYLCLLNHSMTERELIKLEAMIRKKMEDIIAQRVSLKDSGIGGMMNTLKKADEALYERILPEYKQMVASRKM